MDSSVTGKAQRDNNSSLSAFLASIGVSTLVLAAAMLAFLCLKDRHRRVYEPRTRLRSDLRQIPPLLKGPIKWIGPIISCSDEAFLDECGTDAYLFTRHLQKCMWLFAALAGLLVPVLFSLNLLRENQARGLDRLSWASVDTSHASYYWGNLCLTLAVIIATLYMVSAELGHLVKVRQRHLLLLDRKGEIFVYLQDVPVRSLTETCIRRLYESKTGTLNAVWIDRAFGKLRECSNMFEKSARSLERAETEIIRRSVLARGKQLEEKTALDVHALPLRAPIFSSLLIPLGHIFPKLISRSLQRDKHLKTLLEIKERVKKLEDENLPPRSAAVLCFNNYEAAYLASKTVVSTHPLHQRASLLDCGWDDIMFQNLSVSWPQLYIRHFATTLLLVTLILGWTVPIAFAGSLSQLSDLSTDFKWTRWLGELPSWLIILSQGILPQVLCALLMIIFPYIVRLVMERRRLPTRIHTELAVQRYYFTFLHLHLFFTVSVSSGLTAVLYRLADNPKSAAMILAQNLPKASNYFLSYIFFQACSVAADTFLQIRTFLAWPFQWMSNGSARQIWERKMNKLELTLGTLFPIYTNLACIVIIYSAIAPLILPIAALAFGLLWLIYRYYFLYLGRSVPHNGGMLYPQALSQMFVGLYTLELCISGLFLLARNAENELVCLPQLFITLSTIPGTAVYHIQLYKTFSSLLRQKVNAIPAVATSGEELPIAHELFKDNGIWLPKDLAGICDCEITQLLEVAPAVRITNDGANIDEAGRIHVIEPPDGFNWN